MNYVLILALVFFITLAIGVPIVWSLVISSMVACLWLPGVSLAFFAQKLELGSEKYQFLAIFFFILAGSIMQHGGIARRLIRFARSATGSISGAMSIVTIVTCIFFAALSGSSIATTAAIGAILYPELVKEGYDKGYAAALPVVGGTLGVVIPPSIPFVVYGTTTNTSVTKLLMSGIGPGVLAGIAMCIYAAFYAKRRHLTRGEKFNSREFFSATKDAIWALLMPVIVLGGIYAGIFTATESAAVACIYGLLVSCVIYRELGIKRLVKICIDSAKSTANCMVIIMAASLFSYVLTRYNIPTMIYGALTTFITSKVAFLLALNLLLLILGMLMEVGAIILILSPIIYPVAMSFGIDPIQLGCIVVFNLSVGQATPPFGVCLFASQSVTRQSIGTMSKNSIPYYIILYALVLLTSFVPAISTLIPNMMFG